MAAPNSVSGSLASRASKAVRISARVRPFTATMKGKRRRYGRAVTKRPDWKKAMVTLAAGEKIELFEGV